MNILYYMNQVIEHIENNLKGDLLINELAKISCMSSYRLQTMFSVLTGITIGEYIRRRKLTQAAFDLQLNKKVIDVAYDYGYSSPDSFTKAFTKMHGVLPSKVKQKNISLKSYSRISFQISIKGDSAMNYKIVEKEAFEMYGVERYFTNVNDESWTEIPKFWDEVFEDGTFDKLLKSTNAEAPVVGIDRINAVMCYKGGKEDTFPYLIGGFITDKCNPKGYTVAKIGAYTWAVFRTVNHKSSEIKTYIQSLWHQIFSEWLPSSGYELLDGPSLELYGNDHKEIYSEVWLPVKKCK